jgi:two-component system, LuxR family, response regulator FixJ
MRSTMIQSPTVSVVDDDQQVRESLATLIQGAGLDVKCYASGHEFLDSFAPQGPGCVVLDLRLPQINGMEVIDRLAQRNIKVPIIMISGHGDIPAAVAAMKAGAVDFLEKPYHASALMDSIHRAIDVDTRSREANAERDELRGRYQRLTDDERQVLQLTTDGKPDKVVALKLDLSLRTIQLRRASLMRKMEAHSRAELIRLAHLLEL